jgi:hypothetical protein
VPTGPSQDLPPHVHEPYEEAIRQACRTVGRLYLDDDNIPGAWPYYRMIGENEPIAKALDSVRLLEGEDVSPLVDIAFHQGVHPRKGFELILERYGLCNAITTMGGGELPFGPEVREHCIRKLVRALHAELRERLAADIARVEGKPPVAGTIPQMLAGRDDLFADEYAYHVDVSHLSSVVQLASQLGPSEELNLARELCAYGQKLSPRFQYATDPPFDNQYRDYGVYLATLAGDDVDAGIAHFRAKVEQADPEETGTFPAEVVVNLLLRVGRPQEAVQVARRYLAGAEERRLTCPGLAELCDRAKDYRTLAEVAREQKNPVQFVAGLIAAAAPATTR